MKIISTMLAVGTFIMMNIKGQDIILETQCLPNGCFYDLEEDLTKQIECKPDGSLEILYFHGNNGCDLEQYLLPELSYKSDLENPCCIAEGAPVCKGSCINDASCYQPGEPCYCFMPAGLGIGECREKQVDEEPSAPEGTQYSVTVINKSGASHIIGIFETNPSDAINSGGFPVVFGSQSITKGGDGNFKWTTNWGLSWSSGQADECQQLSDGIIYSRNGGIIPVSPSNKEENAAKLTSPNTNSYEMNSDPNSNLQPGQLEISTDDSFKNVDAQNDCLTVCVTMNGDTVFAMDAQPSTDYLFTIKPSYYLSIVVKATGETVDATAISQSYKIPFINGNNNIQCILDERNQFSCVNQE